MPQYTIPWSYSLSLSEAPFEYAQVLAAAGTFLVCVMPCPDCTSGPALAPRGGPWPGVEACALRNLFLDFSHLLLHSEPNVNESEFLLISIGLISSCLREGRQTLVLPVFWTGSLR